MKDIKKLRNYIRMIADSDAVEIFQGIVDHVNDDGTIDVDIDQGAIVPGVRLRVVTGVDSGMIITPKKGSAVVFAKIENTPDHQLIHASEIDRAYIRVADTILDVRQEGVIINEGKNGGAVKIKELTEKLNALEKKTNELIAGLKSTVIPLAPTGTYPLSTNFGTVANLPPTAQADIENAKLKH